MKEHGVMDFTPVLIGGGQAMLRARVEGDKVLGPSPLDLMQQSVAAAWKDAGIEAANDQVDALGLTRLAMDTIANGEDRNSQYANFPGALAEKIGASADAKLLLTEGGGSSPQKLINILAERIARGELSCAVVAGAEALDTQTKRYRQGVSPQWEDAECGSQRPAWENTGSPRASGTDHERKHKLVAPVNCYPLYAHGLAARDGQSSAEHRRQCAELFAGFSKVATANPFSWFPQERSAQEIAEVTDANRMIGLPYTKYLNAVMQVNQGAAVLICSYRKAMELGVSKDKVVFLHGCAEASEIWNQTERVDFISSPAIRSAASKALEIADIGPGKLRYLDIYSCFPCAVQIACAEIGLEPRTGDQLTLTGGLPYFGGAGNNYALHGVVEMLKRLRADPGSYGLVNANGWYLTKHAVGIYSTTAPPLDWHRPDMKAEQVAIDAQAVPSCENPQPGSQGTIETYTVTYNRQGPELGIVMARLADGRRAVANIPKEESATLASLKNLGRVGREGQFKALSDGRVGFELKGVQA